MVLKGSDSKIELEEITACPECDSKHLIRDYNRGEMTCSGCGLVVDDNFIDQGPEWRAFDAEQNEKRSRGGAPMTVMVHDKGLSTDIGWGNRDTHGNVVPTRNRAQLFRMRKWQNRTRASTSADRNLAMALKELNRLASKIGLHRRVREDAAMLYRRAVNQNLVRGRSVEGVAAAALYGACRRCEVPRTLNEITAASRANKKEVGRTYRYISRELKLNLQPASPVVYINRFCRELVLSGRVENAAIRILNQAVEAELTSGRGPTGVAAASIYVASVLYNSRKTQKCIAETVGVTEVTIRNRYKELAENLDITVQI
ncbi:MAG TPA: transcription initiation factor IIB [Candidatus Poseidoniia archaeon]|jgi:transcription initiation factor TFIIB|nr:transcription initiation factor IIB [Candidatus Poseidoniia archaeon]|tara:strand:- start:570 stop:1514 length:945 start_codon:yes stop_codon:yes gene_type:complete